MARVIVLDSACDAEVLANAAAATAYRVTRIASARDLRALGEQLDPSRDSAIANADPGGLELCRCLKDDAATRVVPVLLVARSGDVAGALAAAAVGADAVLWGPPEAGTIVREIARVRAEGRRLHASVTLGGLPLDLDPAAVHDAAGLLASARVTPGGVHDSGAGRTSDTGRFHRRLLESASDAIFVIDLSGHVTFVNDRGCDMVGAARESIVGRRYDEYTEPAQLASQRARFESLLATGASTAEGSSLRRLDGSTLFVDIAATVVDTDRGRWIVSIVRDVTRRTMLERQLRASEERLRSVVRELEALVFTVDAGGRVTGFFGDPPFADPAALAGYVGRTPSQVLGDGATPHEIAIRRALAGESTSYEWSQVIEKGTRIYWTACWPSRDGAGNVTGVTGVVRDVSAERRLRSQLQVANRLASLGTLAGGVAHEINNPLAAIVSNAQLLKQEISDLGPRPDPERVAAAASEWQAALADALEAAARVAHIVADLGLFAGLDNEATRVVSLRPILESALRLASNEIRHHARLTTQFEEVPPVRANEARLGQVFLDLVSNAVESMPLGDAERNLLDVRVDRDASGRVVVAIMDTGHGIDPEHSEHIFDPLFTTKRDRAAMGMGLSVAHRTITDLGGEITVESRLGAGTTVRVLLPPAPEQAGASQPSVGANVEGRRAILAIDDDELVLLSLRRLLRRRYEVTTVSRAREALALLESGRRFDVLLCDLMMPDVPGMGLLESIRRVAPDQAERVIFVTGGAFTPEARAFLAASRNPVVEKPFEPEALNEVMLSVIARCDRESDVERPAPATIPGRSPR